MQTAIDIFEACEKTMPATMSGIDKAVSKGIFAKNTAVNKKNSLQVRLNALKASK